MRRYIDIYYHSTDTRGYILWELSVQSKSQADKSVCCKVTYSETRATPNVENIVLRTHESKIALGQGDMTIRVPCEGAGDSMLSSQEDLAIICNTLCYTSTK